MSVFVITSIRVIKDNDDFITNAGTYVRLLSGYGTNTIEQAIEAFKKGFDESRFIADGWELIGLPTYVEITRKFVDDHIECFADEIVEATTKLPHTHLKVIK